MKCDHNEIIEGMKMFFRSTEEAIPNQRINGKQSMLIILHTFTAGGSQAAILEIVPLLHQMGWELYAVAPDEGIYKQLLVEAGVSCSIADSISNTVDIRLFFEEAFDLVLLNSICSCHFSYYFINGKTPVLWWVHEAPSTIASSIRHFPYPNGISDNFRFLGVTKEVVRAIQKLYGKDAEELPFPVKDKVTDARQGLYANEGGGCTSFYRPLIPQ